MMKSEKYNEMFKIMNTGKNSKILYRIFNTADRATVNIPKIPENKPKLLFQLLHEDMDYRYIRLETNICEPFPDRTDRIGSLRKSLR